MNTVLHDECVLYSDLVPTLGPDGARTLVALVHEVARRSDLQERNARRANDDPVALAHLFHAVAATSGGRQRS